MKFGRMTDRERDFHEAKAQVLKANLRLPQTTKDKEEMKRETTDTETYEEIDETFKDAVKESKKVLEGIESGEMKLNEAQERSNAIGKMSGANTGRLKTRMVMLTELKNTTERLKELDG